LPAGLQRNQADAQLREFLLECSLHHAAVPRAPVD
jgi:hypothetical protein